MRKYLAFYETEWPANIAELTAVENKPFVGYLKGEGVLFTVIPKPVVNGPWVTFTAEADNSSIGLAKLSTNQSLEYSTDTTTWNNFDTTTNIPLNNGDKVYVRGVLNGDNTSSDYTKFEMTGIIAASGNCNAIWNLQDLNAPLKAYCGKGMFAGCSSLTTAPELPAVVLTEGCYYNMFTHCSLLEKSPVLPATSLPYMCYMLMFMGCTNLKQITCLATDKSGNYCTSYWVQYIKGDGTFVKHPNATWSTGDGGIPKSWTVVDAEL